MKYTVVQKANTCKAYDEEDLFSARSSEAGCTKTDFDSDFRSTNSWTSDRQLKLIRRTKSRRGLNDFKKE